MIRRISGTAVVITGATSGIGRETALQFADAGARVVVAGRREERLKELVSEIEAKGGEALAVRADVADQSQVDNLIETAFEKFGRVDTLVNNAGVALAAKFETQTLEDFRRLMDVNFWGAVYGCRARGAADEDSTRGGVIINISSILGKRGMPFETAYCASKFALAGFSESLRVELMTESIDVVSVFPGAVETEIFESAANHTGLEMPTFLPKFPAKEMARLIVRAARYPQPEIVMALDALAINAANKLVPSIVDLALGWTVPFMDGIRRASKSNNSEKDRRQPLRAAKNTDRKYRKSRIALW
ncbi:MAG: SDR family oxidoreductase [Acidobacteria bacterium]|nr:SDR family oxidoreductase [Acidobacteriota bacterium]